MRIGLVSDVHANLFALRTVLARLRSTGVDAIVCAGDLVGYGPHPNECVETIAELEPICVAGNHELLLLDDIPEFRAGRRARHSIAWTRDVIQADVRSYLASLPRIARGPDMVVAHGSLDDPEEYVRAESSAVEQLRRFTATYPNEHLLVLGHTHRQWLFEADRGTVFPTPTKDQDIVRTAALDAGRRFLVNPGSVGQSRDREWAPRARFAVVDVAERTVRYFAEPYDASACRAALRARGLPVDSLHLRPGNAAAVARRVRRVAARLR